MDHGGQHGVLPAQSDSTLRAKVRVTELSASLMSLQAVSERRERAAALSPSSTIHDVPDSAHVP